MSEVKIYTRKGDDGTTGLWYGGRVKKSDPRTSAYGDVDEAISTIAVARAMAEDSAPEVAADLLEMQRCLFIGCAQLATADESFGKLVPGVTLIEQAMVDALEVTDRSLQGPAQPAAEVHHPRRHRAFSADRRGPHRRAPRRALDRGARRARSTARFHRAGIRQPLLGPAFRARALHG